VCVCLELYGTSYELRFYVRNLGCASFQCAHVSVCVLCVSVLMFLLSSGVLIWGQLIH
jgi:hypothetical protein